MVRCILTIRKFIGQLFRGSHSNTGFHLPLKLWRVMTTHQPRNAQTIGLAFPLWWWTSHLQEVTLRSNKCPSASVDLAATCSFLEEGVDHIMTELQTGISYSRYMGLYTIAYNYRTSSPHHGTVGFPLSSGNRSKSFYLPLQDQWVTEAEASLMCPKLYNKLIQYFIAYLEA